MLKIYLQLRGLLKTRILIQNRKCVRHSSVGHTDLTHIIWVPQSASVAGSGREGHGKEAKNRNEFKIETEPLQQREVCVL